MKSFLHLVSKTLLIAAAFWWGLLSGGVSPVHAQGINILRDAETEWFLQMIMEPIFIAAELDPEAVTLYLVGDDSLNAFVALGQNIFINSGTIMKSQDVDEILGVMAHETGHITGGHDARPGDASEGATAMSLISLLLGAAALAAGAGDAGIALMMGGQGMGQRIFLKNRRIWESSADQVAIRLLEATETSGQGLVRFFDRIRDQELLTITLQDPYVRTHPLTSDRIARLNNALTKSPYYNKPPDPYKQYWYERIKAKLMGFTQPAYVTLRNYPESDQSMVARYARIYAYNKDLQYDRAISEAKRLAADYPDDPYFYEITGQMLLENGRVEEALPYYRHAVELRPEEPLIMTYLGHALVASEEPDLDMEAITVLERVVFLEPEDGFAWRNLATVYARNDREAETSLAMAELFALEGRIFDAGRQARHAMDLLPEGTPKWIRAQDLMMYASVQLEEMGLEEDERPRRRR